MYRFVFYSILLVINVLLMFSCQKNNDDLTNDDDVKTRDSIVYNIPEVLFYLKADIGNGDSLVMKVYDIDTFDTYEIKGFASSITDGDSCILSYNYGFSKLPIINPQSLPHDLFLFSLTRFFSSTVSDCQNAGESQAFPDLFIPGNLNFTDDIEKKGVVLTYLDENGNEWSTLGGNQTGAVFSISNVEEFDNPGVSGVKIQVEGTFNTTLYAQSSGQSDINIISASYKVLFINAFN